MPKKVCLEGIYTSLVLGLTILLISSKNDITTFGDKAMLGLIENSV